MSVDPEELAKFKAALSHTSTEDIQKRLDENVIAREWKRDLAEQEIARRGGGVRTGGSPVQNLKLHRSATLKGWLITIALIAGALVAAAAFLMERMPR